MMKRLILLTAATALMAVLFLTQAYAKGAQDVIAKVNGANSAESDKSAKSQKSQKSGKKGPSPSK